MPRLEAGYQPNRCLFVCYFQDPVLESAFKATVPLKRLTEKQSPARTSQLSEQELNILGYSEWGQSLGDLRLRGWEVHRADFFRR